MGKCFGKADRRMSQVSQPSLFRNVLPMNPSVTLAPSSLFRVGKILIYVNTDDHKLHYLLSHDFAALTREILSSTLENKTHIHALECNVLYLSFALL